ncbi:GNAT family N-acetyltransferase, partial [Acrocarpospora corrugata]|uniref:GNAT family N-acetyltransferase n=1 Tax=Acrocarpospora corrugata TaxID=35763 RepID=UPI001C3FAC3D
MGSLEMGGTWFGRSWWRTAANTETKLLTMTYAFDALGFEAIAWRIDVDNKRWKRSCELAPNHRN